MNIENYTFEEFKQRAASFHGYPAPGLLLGGYMVAMAKAALPAGTLFEAVVETKKCLPDAVQLLTVCSIGNNWMKILNLGKYAVSLFDKHTGEGYRVSVDVSKLGPYPEIKAWFLKEKAKKDQDTDVLFYELETAGDTICTMTPIRIRQRLLGHAHMGAIGVCPHCGEAFPQEDGVLCRGCQGEAPYDTLTAAGETPPTPRVVPVEEIAGKIALHDMTQIIPGESKDAAFAAGHQFSVGDVCRLQQMGRFSVAIDENISPDNFVHENQGAEAFATKMSGANVAYQLPPKEGKVNMTATCAGLLCVNTKRLEAFNMVPDVMCASRQDATVVSANSEIAGTRVIPLYISKGLFAEALSILEQPIFSVAPMRSAKVGILVTGTEVFQGLIQDKFIPTIVPKVEEYGCQVVKTLIAPDKKDHLLASIQEIKNAGADLLITTGGLSVDPDDITRAALLEAGLTDYVYGAPVLPGTMSLVGTMRSKNAETQQAETIKGLTRPCKQPAQGEMQVLGVPACALHFKTTLFDILLPRLLAGRTITRHDFAQMGEGGFCMNCKVCTYPKCFFVK